MSNTILNRRAINAWANRDCKTRMLDIIDFCSPLTEDKIKAILDDSTTLKKLGVSASKCDTCVRKLINNKIRVPAGKPRLPPGSVKPSTKVSKLIKGSCN